MARPCFQLYINLFYLILHLLCSLSYLPLFLLTFTLFFFHIFQYFFLTTSYFNVILWVKINFIPYSCTSHLLRPSFFLFRFQSVLPYFLFILVSPYFYLIFLRLHQIFSLNTVFFTSFMWILIAFSFISFLSLSPSSYFCLINLQFLLVFISNCIPLHFAFDRIPSLLYSISSLIPAYFCSSFFNLVSSTHFLPREVSRP